MESISVKKEVKKEVKSMSLKNVVITKVSSPATVMQIAESRGINPQEVFVRVTFKYNRKEYAVSNKLRILTQKGYKELLEAKEKGTKMNISITDSGFFYIDRDVSIEDLFKVKLEVKDNRTALDTLFAD